MTVPGPTGSGCPARAVAGFHGEATFDFRPDGLAITETRNIVEDGYLPEMPLPRHPRATMVPLTA